MKYLNINNFKFLVKNIIFNKKFSVVYFCIRDEKLHTPLSPFRT